MVIPDSNPSYNATVDEGAGTKATSGTTAEIMAANPDRQYCRITNVDATQELSLGLGEAAVDQRGIV